MIVATFEDFFVSNYFSFFFFPSGTIVGKADEGLVGVDGGPCYEMSLHN